MRKIKFLLVLFVMLFSLSSCDELANLYPSISNGDVETFYVTFMVDGEVVAKIEVNGEEEIKFPEDPFKEGFEFLGWYNLGVKWDETNIVENNIILTAKFGETGTAFSVEFYVDGQIYHLLKYSLGGSLVLPVDPYKEGYKFVGWDYEGVIFDQNVVITGDIKLNAIFEEMTEYFIAEFYVDGELYTKTTNLPNDKLTLPVEPSKEGHKFIGWECDGVIWEDGYLVSADLKLNAVFEVQDIYYCINFIVDGNLVDQVMVPEAGLISDLMVPQKDGYEFIGWFLESGKEYKGNKPVYSDINLYAKFEKIEEPVVTVSEWKNNDAGAFDIYVDEFGHVIFKASPYKNAWSFVYKELPLDIKGDSNIYISFIAPQDQQIIFKIESTNSYGDVFAEEISVYGNGGLQELDWNLTKEFFENKERIRLLAFIAAGRPREGELTILECLTDVEFQYNTVNFIVDGSIYDYCNFKVGQTADYLPGEPYKAGYNFVGWFLESGEEYFLGMPLDGNIDVYARFEKIEEVVLEEYVLKWDVFEVGAFDMYYDEWGRQVVIATPNKGAWSCIYAEIPVNLSGNYDIMIPYIIPADQSVIFKIEAMSTNGELIIYEHNIPGSSSDEYFHWTISEKYLTGMSSVRFIVFPGAGIEGQGEIMFLGDACLTKSSNYYILDFFVEGDLYETYACKEGEPSEYWPSDPFMPGQNFVGWFLESGEEYIPGMLFYGNMNIHAVFETVEEPIVEDIMLEWKCYDKEVFDMYYDERGLQTFTATPNKGEWSFIYADIPLGLSGDYDIMIHYIVPEGQTVIFKIEGSGFYEFSVPGSGKEEFFNWTIPQKYLDGNNSIRFIIFPGASMAGHGDITFFEDVYLTPVPENEYNTVTFYVDNEVYDIHSYCAPEDYAECPTKPYKYGYNFVGWFLESGEEYTSGMLITCDLDVYARFEKVEIVDSLIWSTSEPESFVWSYDAEGRLVCTTTSQKNYWSYIYTTIPNNISGEQQVEISFVSDPGINIIFKFEGYSIFDGSIQQYETSVVGTGNEDHFSYTIPAEFVALVKNVKLYVFIDAGVAREGVSVAFNLVSIPS